MNSLIIPEKNYTPYISFDTESNVFEISGESYSEYTLDFFEPVLHWLSAYLNENKRAITLNIRMTYFNTSTSRRFFEIFKNLEDFYHQKGGYATINWYANSNDIEMIEAGEDYQEDFSSIPFNILVQQAH